MSGSIATTAPWVPLALGLFSGLATLFLAVCVALALRRSPAGR